MPVTLWLIYRAMPESPGFAFGLAASALWPGTLAGQLISLTGAWNSALILVSFAAGLAATYMRKRNYRRCRYEKTESCPLRRRGGALPRGPRLCGHRRRAGAHAGADAPLIVALVLVAAVAVILVSAFIVRKKHR